jgi:hypothetical protein
VGDLPRRWQALDSHVLAHLDAERYVFDMIACIDAREAAELMREHDEIRRRLVELGVDLDLHCLHGDAVHSFVDMLRAHAGREDNLLVRWADERLEKYTSGGASLTRRGA